MKTALAALIILYCATLAHATTPVPREVWELVFLDDAILAYKAANGGALPDEDRWFDQLSPYYRGNPNSSTDPALFRYRKSDSTGYSLLSAGYDKAFGTADDMAPAKARDLMRAMSRAGGMFAEEARRQNRYRLLDYMALPALAAVAVAIMLLRRKRNRA